MELFDSQSFRRPQDRDYRGIVQTQTWWTHRNGLHCPDCGRHPYVDVIFGYAWHFTMTLMFGKTQSLWGAVVTSRVLVMPSFTTRHSSKSSLGHRRLLVPSPFPICKLFSPSNSPMYCMTNTLPTPGRNGWTITYTVRTWRVKRTLPSGMVQMRPTSQDWRTWLWRLSISCANKQRRTIPDISWCMYPIVY